MERIAQYVAIEQEPQPTEGGTPPAYWPSSGDLKMDKVTARYSIVRLSDDLSAISSLIQHAGWACRTKRDFIPCKVWRAYRHWWVIAICYHILVAHGNVILSSEVGRTGSGKSSLTLSLLRCILTDGDIYYDGLSTSSINLDALRSNITIIPQVVKHFSFVPCASHRLISSLLTARAPTGNIEREP